MKWRNKIAHGTTERIPTSYTESVDNYEELFYKIEQSSWKKYIIDVDIGRIEKDCKKLMETIHLKALGHLEWFLAGTWQLRSAHHTRS
jgi:7,8-dihydro-6-hydroxymethylpterin-pyrophosphokinase